MDGEKIEIARLLLAAFRGREDYVARGTERGTFEPVKLPCPMRPEWLRKHLEQEQCLGFYLMTADSKCWCSTIDFDNKAHAPDPLWKDKVMRLHLWLQQCGLSPLVEISASGEAAHVWLFLDEPTPAWLLRAWWRVAAKKTGIVFAEIYPRQDHLTNKGLGNLVRYPLWNRSQFVDPEDDWRPGKPVQVLSGIRRTSGPELKDLAFRLGIGELRQPDQVKHTTTPTIVQTDKSRIPPRVQDRLGRTQSILAKRWAGDMSGLRDQSRSGLVQSIACELVRQYVPTQEIEDALYYWCQEQGYDKADREDWIPRTVSKAYEYVLSRIEERSAGAIQMRDACHQYLDVLQNGTVAHLKSGINALDSSIDGIGFGEMGVIAARPGHGKSALALQWLDYTSANHIPCLLLSEEMSALELGKRALASMTVYHQDNWTQSSVPMLRSTVDKHYDGRAPIHVVESCYTIDRAEDVIDQFCALHGVRLAVLDYLQLLGSRASKRYDGVSEISRRLKQAAKRNNCAILACCQMNREIESRDKWNPLLRDLRDSGQIEQDADLVIFLQWPYRLDNTAPATDYVIHIAKRRNGPIRTHRIETIFSADYQRIGTVENLEYGV